MKIKEISFQYKEEEEEESNTIGKGNVKLLMGRNRCHCIKFLMYFQFSGIRLGFSWNRNISLSKESKKKKINDFQRMTIEDKSFATKYILILLKNENSLIINTDLRLFTQLEKQQNIFVLELWLWSNFFVFSWYSKF